jgi:hypothetical protein
VVLFGVKPTFAATGYGYIQPGEAIEADVQTAGASARNRRRPTHTVWSRPVACGIPASSWRVPLLSWRSSRRMNRECWPPSAARWRWPRSTRTSYGWILTPSALHPRSRSTMR